MLPNYPKYFMKLGGGGAWRVRPLDPPMVTKPVVVLVTVIYYIISSRANVIVFFFAITIQQVTADFGGDIICFFSSLLWSLTKNKSNDPVKHPIEHSLHLLMFLRQVIGYYKIICVSNNLFSHKESTLSPFSQTN